MYHNTRCLGQEAYRKYQQKHKLSSEHNCLKSNSKAINPLTAFDEYTRFGNLIFLWSMHQGAA